MSKIRPIWSHWTPAAQKWRSQWQQSIKTVDENSRWKQSMKTVDENSWWKQLMKTVKENSRWKQSVDGNSRRKQSMKTVYENSLWKQSMKTVYENSRWKQSMKTRSLVLMQHQSCEAISTFELDFNGDSFPDFLFSLSVSELCIKTSGHYRLESGRVSSKVWGQCYNF
jgi:hypothetical protein